MLPIFEEGAVAIITGAGPGMGRTIALGFARWGGVDVALAARRREQLDAVAAEVRELGPEPLVVPANLSRAEGCHALVAQAQSGSGAWCRTATTTPWRSPELDLRPAGAVISPEVDWARRAVRWIRKETVGINAPSATVPECSLAATSRAASAGRWMCSGSRSTWKVKSVAKPT